MSVAPVSSPLSSDNTDEVLDFLRRLASMMSGGRNAELLLDSASLIERLTQRASSAEQLFRDLQEDHAENIEMRDVAELASDNLMVEVAALKAKLAENERLAGAEIALLRNEIAERKAQAELDRETFADATLRMQAAVNELYSRLEDANASLDALRRSAENVDKTVAVVPVEALQTARDQFAFLSEGFARTGDLVSQTICEVGACAIDKALAGPGADS
jgi:hypothetical protein